MHDFLSASIFECEIESAPVASLIALSSGAVNDLLRRQQYLLIFCNHVRRFNCSDDSKGVIAATIILRNYRHQLALLAPVYLVWQIGF